MNYHLVLELLPGDFMPVDISLLKGSQKDVAYDSLELIDSFTRAYTEDEMMAMIEESNIVTHKYLEGKLKIINSSKYRYPVMSKDTNMSLDTFFEKNIADKLVMNKFMNIYLKYSQDNSSEIKKAINEGRIDIILHNLFLLPYEKVRGIYMYLYENVPA